MTLPLSPSETVRFTPSYYDDPATAPVYLLKTPSWLDRARWRKRMAELGVMFVADRDYVQCLRDGAAYLAGGELPGELKDILDRREGGMALEVDEIKVLAELIKKVQAGYPDFAELVGRNNFASDVVPILTTKMFLLGWENLNVAVKRTNGELADEALEALPSADLVIIGTKLLGMMTPTREDLKN